MMYQWISTSVFAAVMVMDSVLLESLIPISTISTPSREAIKTYVSPNNTTAKAMFCNDCSNKTYNIQLQWQPYTKYNVEVYTIAYRFNNETHYRSDRYVTVSNLSTSADMHVVIYNETLIIHPLTCYAIIHAQTPNSTKPAIFKQTTVREFEVAIALPPVPPHPHVHVRGRNHINHISIFFMCDSVIQ